MQAAIKAIAYHLPVQVLTNSALEAVFPEWPATKIEEKTGIATRHIAARDECASDLGSQAAEKLFASGVCQPQDVDYLLLCTQSPDYFLPTTACLLQKRLGLPQTAGALDFNLGCSGFVYGLGLAKGLIETGQAQRVLLITAETYSKFIHPGDKSVRTLFGDAAAATLLQGMPDEPDAAIPFIGPFVFGTDGSGADNLMVPTGGLRAATVPEAPACVDAYGNTRTVNHLYMDGPELLTFTLRVVPSTVQQLLLRAQKTMADIDLFVFHQANQYMLEHLRKKLRIPQEKFVVALRDCGNTVSATIPIALRYAQDNGFLQPGHLVMLIGFGVGYSWGGTLVRWVG